MATEILMPALSPTMEEGTLAKWLVREGDTVSSGDILAEIETDKATMEFEAVDEGIVGRILVAEGTTNVFARTINDLALRRGGVPAFDPVTSEWSFQYALTVDDGVTECIQNREVRWVDAEGAAQRADLARRAGWGGVALWALGYEDADVWASLLAAAQDPIVVPSTTE